MNKRLLSIFAIAAILLSTASMALQVRQIASAARPLAASIPEHISYQGRLTDAVGVPLNGDQDMRFCLYAVPTGGSALWCEDQEVAVATGVFSVLLGSVTPLPDAVFGDPDLYLGVMVGSDAEMAPRQQIVSVGYAYQAEDAALLDGREASEFADASHKHNQLSGPNGAPEQAVYVDGDGDVGIGTTNTQARLTILGSESNTGLEFSSSSSGVARIYSYDHVAQQFKPMLLRANADSGLWLVETGNVGIGTGGPQQKLSVKGTVQSTTGGFMFPDGTVQATAAPAITEAEVERSDAVYTSSEDWADVPNTSVTVATDGSETVLIIAKAYFYDMDGRADVRLVEDSTVLDFASEGDPGANEHDTGTAALMDLRTPTAGSHIYKLQWKTVNGSSTISFRKIIVVRIG